MQALGGHCEDLSLSLSEVVECDLFKFSKDPWREHSRTKSLDGSCGGEEDIPRTFWQVDPADSHIWHLTAVPKAQHLGSLRLMALLSPGGSPAHHKGPKGSAISSMV